MSILSDFEDRIGSAIEGLFAGAFRSPVQPAEIAKALARAMDKGRKVGVKKVYVPNLYTVVISAEDDNNLGGFTDTLAAELVTYLLAYAREHVYAIPGRPVVRFVVDPRLRLGRFDAYGELVADDDLEEPAEEVQQRFVGEPAPERPEMPEAPLAVPALTPEAPLTPPVHPDSEIHTLSTVTVGDTMHDIALKGERVLIGRLSDCDICIEDANISRSHAAFVREGDGWAIEDLDSTNGTFLNGERVTHVRLRDGDNVGVGASRLTYHEPRR